MKILLLSPAHPLRGGIATSTERLAQEMLAAGHDVVIYSFSVQYPSFLFPGKSQTTDDPPPPGLQIFQKLNSVNPFNWLRVGWQIARRERPEKIVVRFWLPFMGPCLGTVLRVARWFSPKKLAVTALVDNAIPHEKRVGDHWLARYFLRACDDFVVMSCSVEKDIRSLLGGRPQGSPLRVKYAPHPLYDNYGDPISKAEARQKLGLPADAPLVLFFGLIRPYKGLDLLLEAMADPRLAQKNIHVVVAGEPYGRWEPYAQILENQKLESRTHLFLDFIPAENVRLFFCAADLIAQPYRSATQSGISQIAFHFEKPMLVTRVGGLPEIVAEGKSGYVVEPAPEAIAEAIFDFFENERAAELTAGVRAEKVRFSWKNLMLAILGNPIAQ